MVFNSSVMKTYGRIDISFTHGIGSYLYAENGKKIELGRGNKLNIKSFKSRLNNSDEFVLKKYWSLLSFANLQ